MQDEPSDNDQSAAAGGEQPEPVAGAPPPPASGTTVVTAAQPPTTPPAPPASGGDENPPEPPAKVIDLTENDPLPEKGVASIPTATVPSSIELRDRDPQEEVRGDLARGLLWLLTLTIGGVLLFVGTGKIKSDVLTQSIFPSLVTLTGTALGFYFGSQSTKDKQKTGS